MILGLIVSKFYVNWTVIFNFSEMIKVCIFLVLLILLFIETVGLFKKYKRFHTRAILT
jgi:branched-subunit amino acid ABC-type transport system permease component